MRRRKVKATWRSIVRAVQAGGQSCNILPICDKMVLKCLFTYLIEVLFRTVLVEEIGRI